MGFFYQVLEDRIIRTISNPIMVFSAPSTLTQTRSAAVSSGKEPLVATATLKYPHFWLHGSDLLWCVRVFPEKGLSSLDKQDAAPCR